MSNDTFRDWIPPEADQGAITDSGYQDWVPAPEPQPQVIEENPPQGNGQPDLPEEVYKPAEEPVVPPLEGGQE